MTLRSMTPSRRARWALLAALAASILTGAAFLGPLKRDYARHRDLEAIQHALDSHQQRHGAYPPQVSPEALAAGVDGCVAVLLEGMGALPEDPLSTGGYAQPGPDRWCYYYRLLPTGGYQLFARLEAAWAWPRGCSPSHLYRPELADYDVCLADHRRQVPRHGLTERLRRAHFGQVLAPLLLALAVSGLVAWGVRRRGHPYAAAALVIAVAAGCWTLHGPLDRDATRFDDLVAIREALDAFERRHGAFPPEVSPEARAAGVDACVGSILAGLEDIPEDPLFSGGYAQPGRDRWCYYYRLRPQGGYQLFARLEWGSPRGCRHSDRYRAELQDFDVCTADDRPPPAPVTLQERLRRIHFRDVLAPLLVFVLAAAAVGLRLRRAGHPRVAAVLVALVATVSALLFRPLNRDATRYDDLSTIQSALDAYRLRHGTYPPAVSAGEVVTGVDACVSRLLEGIEGIPEDPLFSGGYSQPDRDHWCYYYRLRPPGGYQLFVRLEVEWGTPRRCGHWDRYRSDLADFDLCLSDQRTTTATTLLDRLPRLKGAAAMPPLLLVLLPVGLVALGLRRQGRVRLAAAVAIAGAAGSLALFGPWKRDTARLDDLATIRGSLEAFKLRNGSYPPPLASAEGPILALDGCASTLLDDPLGWVPEDPYFSSGYAQPDLDHWCYYYRVDEGEAYRLFGRLELPWGWRRSCAANELYRGELTGFDVCLRGGESGPPSPPTLRGSLRGLPLIDVLAPFAWLAMVAVALRLSWSRRGEPVREGPRERIWAVATLCASLFAFHLIVAELLRWYYARYLPHYDSVGMYTWMARTVWLVRDGQVAETLPMFTGLGWLAPAFALVTSPWITPHPAGFQLLNTICVALFAFSLALAARTAGASFARSVVVSLVVLLPDALMNWDAGYQDFKRDSQFLPLLGATYFLLFAHLWEPRAVRGVLLGVVAGITVWSRGEAVVYMGCLLAPIAVVAGWKGGWGRTASALSRPALIAFVVALPFLVGAVPAALSRRAGHIQAFTTDSPWASLQYYWSAPFHLWLVSEPALGATPSGQALALGHWLLLVGGAVAIFGLAAGPPRHGYGRTNALLLGGVWAYVSNVALICFGMRWKPGYGWSGYPPFYPAILALMSVAVVLMLVLPGDRPPRRALRRWLAVGALCLVSFGLVATRMWLRAPEQREPVATARWLLEVLRSGGRRPVVAMLMHARIDTFTLMFYEALDHYDPERELQRFIWNTPSGDKGDYSSIMPPGGDVQQYRSTLLRQLQRRADWVIVDVDLTQYERPPDAWTYFLTTYGRPVVEGILTDPGFERVASYTIGEGRARREFLVLRNRRRPAPFLRLP